MTATRIEHDAFGPVEIPAGRYWGAQTQRALGVFDVGTERFPVCLLHAFGLQKIAAARANARCAALDAALAESIATAAGELSRGLFDDHFPLTIWQTGSGTQTNMNANEVIANRANELLGQPLGTKSPVHPNDHVNASQSSNDSFPTVMHIAAAMELTQRLIPSLTVLKDALEDRARAFADAAKVARTHLMDAVPMTMGQAFEAFAWQANSGIARLKDALPRLLLLAQGGTAAGTGLNAPENFDVFFCEEIGKLTGLPFEPHPCKFEGMSGHDALVELSGALNVIAASLMKMANDIRWMGSGPRCGIGELVVPNDGLTSSIMPGKRNPTIAEVVAQAAMQVAGNHVTVTMAGASGNFELNVAKPVLIHGVLQSIRILADSARVFASRLVAGLEVDRERLEANLGNALLSVTALNPVLGYDKVARITRTAVERRIAPREAAVELGYLSAEAYDRLVNPLRMAKGKS
ncbi:lyase family protein [Variovorax sp. SG517]|uniref:class II fumarate hydratase n=1 Tax=unclassified Variovorax TaxID=663243 RepID=UPI00159EA3D9|nr:class II fumarate hydratase [Variovorax sp. SG517]NVM86604.1 fumarate hydratase class II [Variovorax sp. SG517]